MKLIKDLKEGDRLSQVMLCKTKQSLTAKTGRTYYSLLLQDKTGTVDGKIWDLNNGIDHFESMDFICVEAEVTSFNGANQLNIRRVRRAREGEYIMKDYFPITNKDVETMYQELLRYGASVKNPYLQQLLSGYFVQDQVFIKKFKGHSAAKSVHHGFIGGLLEHTLGVVKICDFFSTQYPLINRDLLITAAFFHDVGKLEELSPFPDNDYTDNGQLLGHIVIGCEMIGSKIAGIPGFPAKIAAELKHCILAHHGEFEYGSPKKPALIEAMALNFADNADAKLEMFQEILQDAPSGEWLGFQRFVDSNVRKTTSTE